MLKCRCGKKMMKFELKEVTLHICPDYDGHEPHDAVVVQKK